MEKTKMYQISTEQVNNSQCCGSLGGDIVLPRGDSIPKCEECNNDMTLYFQIDVIPELLVWRRLSATLALHVAECQRSNIFSQLLIGFFAFL